MKARPVLGIIACNRQVGSEMAQAVMNRYVSAAMRYADVAALIVPSLPGLMAAREIAPRLDGILLTGTPSNVAPERYGDMGDNGPLDRDRDEMVFALIDAMIGRARPVFGICRGFQEINVALGGTLRRDVSALDAPLKHHAPDDYAFDAYFEHTHSVTLSDGGLLAAAYGSRSLNVNSVHYQGVATLAPDVTTEAIAPDGLVEAFSTTRSGAQILAVQWHPEWDAETNADSRAYFKMLGSAIRGSSS